MPDASVPQRTCVGCRSVDDAHRLVRFVLTGGVLTLDDAGRATGRGAWLHDAPDCAQQARKRGAFARSFRRKVDDAVLDQIIGE